MPDTNNTTVGTSVNAAQTVTADGNDANIDEIPVNADQTVTAVEEENDDESVLSNEINSQSSNDGIATDTSVDESPKVCVQMVKDQTVYDGIGNDTTIAIKNDNGKYTVFKKSDPNPPVFSPGNTYQQIVELSGVKRRKTAKRGGKSSKRGRKSAKKGRKSVKRGRKGKGSRRSKK